MINIIRSLILTFIGLGPLAVLSVIFIITMTAGLGPDSGIAIYIGDYIINSESLADAGDDFEDVSAYIFKFFRDLNISLLFLTVIMTMGWSVGSHYLNIDAPGKAKIYFIHWAIFTAIFSGLVFAITFYFTQSTAYQAQQFLTGSGKTQIVLGSLVFYVLMYYAGVLLGTARFARSSVLLANKLPGGF